MDEAFEALKRNHQNSVDNLIEWMKDARVIEKEKAAEDKARKLFKDVKDDTNVELAKFKEVVTKIAKEHRKTGEEVIRQLSSTGPKFLDAIEAAAKAFKETLRKSMSK